ncbi:O-antigen ligase [Winogradskyella sp.]|uniref:O-antigen ligase family protein n=1 Tax=Winogradskyella sp. TaxID=1883156 RepID=UPI002627003D|nr:O-antigen ligase family protein [Winogradskyella sp.]
MEARYISGIVLHICFGALLYFVGFFPKLFFFGTIGYFLFKIIVAHPKEKTTAVLMGCAYLTGAEVIFRMTDAGLFYESSKYFIIFYIIFGTFYNGVSNKGYPYFIFLICLVPSIIVAFANIGVDASLRKNVAFVLSGPVCLGISALYCYDKKITLKQTLDILFYLALPVVTLTTYLFLYTPSIKDIITDTESNFAASGGFGPNQVSTVLGLGMFVFCVNYFLNSRTKLLKIINIILFALVSFRGIITFSRGGVLTAILMIFAFLFIVYSKSNWRQKNVIIMSFLSFMVMSTIIWAVSSNQTNGLIDKRYTNQDKIGREKKDVSAGRVDLFVGELEGFIEEPFLGVGASGMKERRLVSLGRVIATHNELSRLLSEHGILGIFMLLILIFKPLDMRGASRHNYFFYAFLIFWFATINHSAMRIAAPGFIYGLALLNIRYEKRSLRRKRIVE